MDVKQNPSLLQVQEGKNTNFTCSFPSNSFYTLHWYIWKPAKSPKNLFVISKSLYDMDKGHVRVTLNAKEGKSYLYIKGSQLEDSAMYLCAFDTVLYKHLLFVPKPMLLWCPYQQRNTCWFQEANS